MKKQRKVEKDNRGVAIYARKSRITNKGDSIGVQFKQCADYAKKELGLDEDYEFLQYEDKGLSGYFSDRPDFQRMLHDVQDGKIKAIVCYKLDRVGRKTADLIRLMDFLEMYRVNLLICSNGINTASGLYKIFIQIFAVIAEFERDTLTERIVDNMMELAKDGRWLGGNTPMGFTVRRVTTGSGKGKSAYSYLESLPEEKQYKGGRTVDELLQDMAEGKTLDDAETEYVKIFANLKDFEKAQQKAELKHDFSEDFVKDLESKGISRDELDGMQIKIESNGNVTVSGIEDKEVREQVQKLVEEKYSDRMYQYYTGIADSVGNLSSNTYQYATDVQEVRRYLKGVTGEDISLENLYLTPDGKIGGLPEKAANLINKTKDNAKIERIKDALINIIGHNRTSGDLGIPDFTSEFQFSNGAFSVADSGFTVDMAALDRRLTPQPHDNMYSDMYEYSFRKVL